MLAPALQDSYRELRTFNLFEGIPNDDLRQAIASGAISLSSVERDRLLADPDNAAAGDLYFVVEGQLAVGVFERRDFAQRRLAQDRYDQLSADERREESALAPPPLARTARKNLAAFLRGDLLNPSAVAATAASRTEREAGEGAQLVALYSIAPSRVAVIAHRCVSDLVLRFPFFEARMRRAVEAARARLGNITGVKQEILDFFVRQGLSVSGQTVRVRQLDLCIDCKQCEIACEDRYGAKRLTLGGYQLGMLDFIYTCRTCTDQRCVDPCEYDSIRYDSDRGEVVINEASCTGCTLCGQLCPYGAIEMVDVEDPQNPAYREEFKLRLDGSGKLAFGPGTARVARPRRVANKCDHCGTYSEQACVTACPTGSLVEVDAYDLFVERSTLAAAVARSGYDRDIPRDKRELLPIRPFVSGAGVKQGGLARIKRVLVGPGVLWALGLTAWFLCLAEIVLRLYEPTLSLQYQLELLSSPPGQALMQVQYHAGSDLAVYCGYVGSGLLLLSILYPIMRRIKSFRLVANARVWFDLHMMAGTVGPMFILLHSALKLDNWVSAAFWSMIVVVVSGIVGRYLYTQIPDLVNGRELEDLDHRRALSSYRRRYPDAVRAAEEIVSEYEQRATAVAERRGLVYAFFWLVMDDLRRPGRWLRRQLALRDTAAPRKVVRELRQRTGRLLLVGRRRVLANHAQLILHSWKLVHVPFSFIMAAFSAVHIWVAFQYSM